MSEWEEQVREWRAEKDEYFRESPQSPIPADARDDFDGLDYFPPDRTYRFELALHEFADHDELVVETTQSGARRYLRWGEFRFEVDDAPCTLTAYKAAPDEAQLWVPFTDETNGDETYGAGRYLDLDAEDRSDGDWVVDFNYAYSPFCAYSDVYECPLVPRENHLDVRIEAGEKA